MSQVPDRIIALEDYFAVKNACTLELRKYKCALDLIPWYIDLVCYIGYYDQTVNVVAQDYHDLRAFGPRVSRLVFVDIADLLLEEPTE